MAQRPVLIELYRTAPIREAAASFATAAFSLTTMAAPMDTAAVPDIPGVTIDISFPFVTIPERRPSRVEAEAVVALAADFQMPEETTYLVRGVMDEDAAESAFAAAEEHPDVKAIFSDPVVEPCITCISTPAVGTAQDVAKVLCVPQMAARGMDGSGVLLAIVDTGINLDYLRSNGLNPNFNATRSWVPTQQPGSPPLVPGELPVAHGTMCAFDALIAAPGATLLDIAVLQSKRPGQTVMDGLLSDAVLGYSFLLSILTGPRRPGDFHSLVVSNSWGMFDRSWDFPVGNPGNYSDNPNHPFNRIVGTLERAGADILFAAGNCGHECPDSRCGSDADAGIFGANSHPQVISIAGVDINKSRVGYSTRGPGHLSKQKPDISSYTHFKGSGVFPVDGGTSAATPVAAGVVAALRSRFPLSPTATPAMLRNLLTRVAEDKGSIGFDYEYGWGIINGCRLATITSLTASAVSEPASSEGASRASDSSSFQYREGSVMTQEEQQFMQALAAFEQSGTDITATSVDICGTYKKVKPVLQGILPFIKMIPIIGAPAAKAIEALMAGLDSFCSMPSPVSGFTASSQYGSTVNEQSFMQALAAFEQSGRGDVTAAAIDVCGIYKKVKPILQGLLPFLILIPNIGKAIAAALTALMTALDSYCPTA